jgi:hypothetical protein
MISNAVKVALTAAILPTVVATVLAVIEFFAESSRAHYTVSLGTKDSSSSKPKRSDMEPK